MADLQTWQLGDLRVTRLVELEIAGGASWILPNATPENLLRETWAMPHFVREDGEAVMSVHAFIVEADDRRIVIDTCIGNDKRRSIPNWNERQGPFLEELAAAGFPPDSIDTVLCTHLHVDHVGWNTRLVNGEWVPTFANARYLFARDEYAFWTSDAADDRDDVMGDSVKPVFEAGLVDLVDPPCTISPSVRLVPTPGHTPGHVAVELGPAGALHAVVTGDLMHHPVQAAHPDWESSADEDAEQARVTRRAFLEDHAARGTLVLGTHFATPTAGRFVAAGGAWRFET